MGVFEPSSFSRRKPEIKSHQFGRGRVVADDDEAGRHTDAGPIPQLIGLLVVAIEGFECGLKLRRQGDM
jgi:hypothetical protein